MCRNLKLDHLLKPHTKINSKEIKDLNISPETQKSQNKTQATHLGHCCCNIFVPHERETKEKINKWDYIKLKSFCIAKEIANKTKRQPSARKKTFANYPSDKGFKSKIYKELRYPNTRGKKKTQLKSGPKT